MAEVINKMQTDPVFQALLKKINIFTLVSPERMYFIYQFALNYPNGNAAEVGVYRGGSARMIAELMNGRVWLFDTFEGLPETDPDIDLHHEGDFDDTSYESVCSYFEDLNHVELVKGLFPQSVVNTDIDADTRFDLVHLDTDLYKSTLDSLEWFYPRMNKGGVMIFDDYCWSHCPGVNKAVDEFFADKPEKPVYLNNGQAFVIKLTKPGEIPHFYNSIPGWFDFQDIYSDVVRSIRNEGYVVEVGSFLGKSTAYMAVEIARTGKNITFDVVDTWEGTQDETINSKEQANIIASLDGKLYEQFLSNIMPVREFVCPIRRPSVEAAQGYPDGSLDMVFIDAAHDYESVKADIAAWYPKVRLSGVLAGHDYETNWPGVMQAVNEFAVTNNYNVELLGNSWRIYV